MATSGYNDQTPPSGAFYGIWSFIGQQTNSPLWVAGSTTPPTPPYTNSLATNPNIFGAILPYTWAQLSPSEGTYSWSLIDNDMAPWIAAGKQVQLRVFTGGTVGTDSSVANYGQTAGQATPQWVFTAGAAKVTADDGTIYPVYWDATYQAKYSVFISAFAARYDNNNSVQSIVPGVGCFGEVYMDETSATNVRKLAYWQAQASYTQNLWTSAYTWALSTHRSAFKNKPLVWPISSTYIDNDGTHNGDNAIAVARQYNNVWLADNGLVNKLSAPTNIQHHSSAAWNLLPHTEEQLKATSVTGSTLGDDMALSMQFGGLYAQIYVADIQNAAYAGVLAQYAGAVTKFSQSGAIVSNQSGVVASKSSGLVVALSSGLA